MSETPKCPYCEAKTLIDSWESHLGWAGQVKCPNCKSRGPLANYFAQKEKAEGAALVAALRRAEISGDTSDGYHTFNELYDHRAKLFSVIVRNYPELCWKSKKHHDGTMYGGMFIVGINTAEGQASYHYDIDPYWPIFDCQELDRAPEWDGHTPQQAIDRIANLGKVEPENRPLTLEEILAKANEEDWNFVWLEHKKSRTPMQLCPWYRKRDKIIFCDLPFDEQIAENIVEIRKTWRCWPRKPTPEQMQAEKWEE